MKSAYIITILVIIYGFAISQEATKSSQDIIGEWKLEHVDIGSKILYPKVDFFVNISENRLSYNTDFNSCQTVTTITSNRITNGNVTACTLVCCDGRLDTIASFLNYEGYYQISNDTLIISNKNEYLLIKQ
jgi:hypothetical protein